MAKQAMKRLNITKERFEKSRYFKNKYGKLEYVSESGKVFKTEKGKILMFKESRTSKLVNDTEEGAADELVHEKFLELGGDNGQQMKLEEKEADYKYCFDVLTRLYEGTALNDEQSYILMSILYDHMEAIK